MTGGSYRTDCDDCEREIAASSRYCKRCGARQAWFTDDDCGQVTILAKVVLGFILAIFAVFATAILYGGGL